MGFNEMVHTFIVAKYYVHLTEAFGDRGRAAFIHGTRYYGGQRGRRMAQRAIRDGQELNYAAYCRYSEWVNSEEAKNLGITNKVDITETDPDYTMHIHVCPWHYQFTKMGLKDAGMAYCSVLDAAICNGFNPAIVYQVPQTLHDHDYCIQTIKNANVAGESLEKNPDRIKPFEYHCAHAYWSFGEVAEAVFGAEGAKIKEQVLEDVVSEYGKEMADTLLAYRDTNFNIA